MQGNILCNHYDLKSYQYSGVGVFHKCLDPLTDDSAIHKTDELK